MSLSARIAWAMVLGLAAGVFFGELMAPLDVVANAFIRLLQMTVLPYVTVSLITGLGSQSLQEARTIAKNIGLLLLLIWSIVIAIMLCVPFAFPDWETASFFSTSLIETQESPNFVDLYIPANPFRSLADNVVPAVVLFSVVVGVALIGVERRSTLIDNLAVFGQALARVTDFMVALTPIGIFAIAASAAGTMTIGEFERLQVFLVTYISVALLIGFWILPGLITALTPFSYREVLGLARDALITAFMTGSFFIVLPLLTETSKKLFARHGIGGHEADSVIDVVVPASFNFPNTGKITSLLFVLFAAWFTDTRLSLAQYPELVGTAVVSLFGSVTVAIPFLLDLLRIPADMFQLFIVSGVINSRFGTLLAAMHTLVLALVGTCAITGTLRLEAWRMIRYAAVSLLLTALTIGGVRILLSTTVENVYTKDQVLRSMQLLRETGDATVHREPQPPLAPTASRLASIADRGFLRVGYIGQNLPYAFFNADGALVGFDVEMAYRLTRELDVDLEFVPVDPHRLATELASGCCDIVMTGYSMTTERARDMTFSDPYMDETLALLVQDHRRTEFSTLANIQAMDDLTIGVPNLPYYITKLRAALPDADLVPIDDIGQIFDDWPSDRDAVLLTAERGSAFTLLYPQYAVVIPQPAIVRAPLAYPVPRGDSEYVAFVNSWIALKQRDNTIERLHAYWVLGQQAAKTEPRWSILRNVLGWVE
jgi:Na+/H+-dicarboxylate symporter